MHNETNRCIRRQFVVKVWGATLMPELGVDEKDVYVTAMSELVFENVAYIYVDYGIYANEEGTRFIRNLDGGSTHMYLALGKKENLNDYTEYMIGGNVLHATESKTTLALPAPEGTNPWLEGSEIVSMPVPKNCYINMAMSPGQSQPGGGNQVQILNYAD